ARCAADAGAVRPLAARGTGAFSARRAARSFGVDGQPAVLCGLAPGDRSRAGPTGTMACVRPLPLGTDPRPCDRPAPGRDDYGSDAVLRSRALWRRAFRSVRAAFPSGR